MDHDYVSWFTKSHINFSTVAAIEGAAVITVIVLSFGWLTDYLPYNWLTDAFGEAVVMAV